MTDWIIHYEVAAIIIVAIILMLFNTGHMVHTKASSFFNKILYAVLTLGITDLLSVYGLSHPEIISVRVNYFILVIYNIALITTAYMYAEYVVSITKDTARYRYRKISFLAIPIIIEAILVVISPVTHLLFSVDSDGVYVRGPLMPQFLVVMGAYAIFIAYQCIARSRYLTLLQRVSIMMYAGVVIAGLLLTVLMPGILLNAFIVALGALSVYMSMQGEYVDSDRMLGTFSADALEKKVATYTESNKSVNLLILRIGDYERLNTLVGYEGSNEVLRIIAEYLIKLIPRRQVYHLNCLYFGCLIEGSKDDAKSYALAIEDRLKQSIKVDGYMSSVNVPFGIAIVRCPDHVRSADEADSLANMLIKDPSIYDTEHIYEVNESIIKAYQRKKDVKAALIKAVRSGGFDVYYQPIIDLENNRVYSAEALVRLFDDEYGNIFPDEFIPLAEEVGVISQVTSCVLSRVCHFIVNEKLREKGIKRIHVNLSVSECIHGDSNGRLKNIIIDSGLDPDNICFEIPEANAFGNNSHITEGIDRLYKSGLGVVVDDYGTGYSNLSELVSLPIDIVKIDKSLLWMSINDDSAMVILHDIVRMIHKLGRATLVTGVENEQQLKIIKDNGVRYAQGYCYSMPVPEKEFLDYLSNVNEFGWDPLAH